jgi:Mn2+/Fe2+ NRAMP family transporter
MQISSFQILIVALQQYYLREHTKNDKKIIETLEQNFATNANFTQFSLILLKQYAIIIVYISKREEDYHGRI